MSGGAAAPAKMSGINLYTTNALTYRHIPICRKLHARKFQLENPFYKIQKKYKGGGKYKGPKSKKQSSAKHFSPRLNRQRRYVRRESYLLPLHTRYGKVAVRYARYRYSQTIRNRLQTERQGERYYGP